MHGQPKRGVGKTTTAINLSASLAAAEKRTLLIDCDSQGNATSGMGIDGEAIREKNLYHCLIGNRPLREVIVGTQIPHLDLIPANRDLVGIEVEFISISDREKRLRNLLRALDAPYEYVIIDCPPSLGFLTVNALVASDCLIVPLQCEYFAMEGLGHLLSTMGLIKARLNPTLTPGGDSAHHVRHAESAFASGQRGCARQFRGSGLSDGHPAERPAVGEPEPRTADHSL